MNAAGAVDWTTESGSLFHALILRGIKDIWLYAYLSTHRAEFLYSIKKIFGYLDSEDSKETSEK